MIAVDTNLLVYAHRRDSDWHRRASEALKKLAEGDASWAIPWPCLHEFAAIVTHPRIYDPPTPLDKVFEQIDSWIESPTLVLLAERGGYWERLRAVASKGQATGPRIHDARVAALCIAHGVRELWTADRDFSRFPALAQRNPL